MPLTPAPPQPPFHWELEAEAIALRVRWFGICVGYALVNLFPQSPAARPALNAILALGVGYALIDAWWSLRGRIFLNRWPLSVSGMEAVFIGLLCHFDAGVESPFRFYYFLSLLVCAMRYSQAVTYSTFGLHFLSFTLLMFSRGAVTAELASTWLLTVIFLGWATWAVTSLATLVQAAGRRLAILNEELQKNQALLEQRIGERTRQLQESQALLVQQEKQAAFGLLAAGIAHEVGNPLAAISSLVQMLNRRQPPPDAYTAERLHMVDDQLRRIQRTLRELVDFSRPATHDRRPCDVHEILAAALNIAKYYKRMKGKRIRTAFAPGLPRVGVVRDRLVQVFLNLILNALDATEEGGTIEIQTELNSGWLHVLIRDSGSGITPEGQARLFQPYFTTKPTGTGLGLFVCRHILEQSDGRIELAETSPQGTMFRVSLTGDQVREHPDVPAVPFSAAIVEPEPPTEPPRLTPAN